MLIAHSNVQTERITPVEVARSLLTIPSAARILNGLDDLLTDPSAGMSEFSRILRYDPGLTASVLRLRRNEAPDFTSVGLNLEDAINGLGFARIRELIANASATQFADERLDVYNLSFEEFWRQSVATALAAELLAENLGEDVDRAFSLGLLHNVGMLAVNTWARANLPQTVFAHRSWPREFSTAEGFLLGFNQAEVGSALLSSWDFPHLFTETIRLQYVPFRYGPYARTSCLLHAAKWLGAAVCAEDGSPKMPASAYLDCLRLTSFGLTNLVVEIRVRLGNVRNAMREIAA